MRSPADIICCRCIGRSHSSSESTTGSGFSWRRLTTAERAAAAASTRRSATRTTTASSAVGCTAAKARTPSTAACPVMRPALSPACSSVPGKSRRQNGAPAPDGPFSRRLRLSRRMTRRRDAAMRADHKPASVRFRPNRLYAGWVRGREARQRAGYAAIVENLDFTPGLLIRTLQVGGCTSSRISRSFPITATCRARRACPAGCVRMENPSPSRFLSAAASLPAKAILSVPGPCCRARPASLRPPRACAAAVCRSRCEAERIRPSASATKTRPSPARPTWPACNASSQQPR